MGKRKGDRKDRYRGKSYYPKYIQDKLAITFLVITLALFALVMILRDILKIIMNSITRSYCPNGSRSMTAGRSPTGGGILWIGMVHIWLPATKCII